MEKADQQDTSSLLDQALTFHQSGNFDQAKALYSQILAIQPDHADALHLRGMLALDEGDTETAESMVSKALAISPDNPFYCNNYGLILEELKRFDPAIVYYEKALPYPETFLDASINLGGILHRTNQLIRALQINKKALRRHPNCPDLYNNLGYLYQFTLKFEKARRCFEKTLQYSPNHPKGVVNYAKICEEMGDWETSITYFQKALEMGLEIANIHAGLGHCYTRLGQLDLAIPQLEKTLEMDPENQSAQINMCFIQHLCNFQFHTPCYTPFTPEGKTPWDIVLISPVAINELGGGQNPPQMARSLHEMGHRVLYIQPLKSDKHPEPFQVFDEVFLFQQSPPTQYQRDYFRKILRSFAPNPSRNRLVLFDIFSPYLLGMLDVLKEEGFQSAYWCLDEWQMIRADILRQKIEHTLASRVDSLFATSHVLARRLKAVTGKSCPVISNGFCRNHFTLLPDDAQPPADMVLGKEKTFIYWGNLNGLWLDWDWLDNVAAAHPEWSFNIIGNVVDADMKRERPNIHYLSIKHHSELMSYGKHADAGLIFFQEVPLIQAVNPVKAYEYLASGIPIISTPMPELNPFPNTHQVRTVAEFEAAVRQIETDPADPETLETFLKQSSWKARATDFIQHLAENAQTSHLKLPEVSRS